MTAGRPNRRTTEIIGRGTLRAPKTPLDTVPAADDDSAISSSWAAAHETIGEHSEIKFTPKTSSSGGEGTMFYDSDDDHIYVGTE
jgi:hypothetical protein